MPLKKMKTKLTKFEIAIKCARLIVVFMTTVTIAGYLIGSKELTRTFLSDNFGQFSFQAAVGLLILALCGMFTAAKDKV